MVTTEDLLFALADTGQNPFVMDLTDELTGIINDFYEKVGLWGLSPLVDKAKIRIFCTVVPVNGLVLAWTGSPQVLGDRPYTPIILAGFDRRYRTIIFHELVHAVLGLREHGIGWFAPTDRDFELFDDATVWKDIVAICNNNSRKAA